MNNLAWNTYKIGIMACGGVGGVGGMCQYLADVNLIPNNETYHRDIVFDQNIPCRDQLSAIYTSSTCLIHGFVGGIFGGIAGAVFPLTISIYGLKKWRDADTHNQKNKKTG
jgi:hypothetical protein